jgi:hypothetical protein
MHPEMPGRDADEQELLLDARRITAVPIAAH